MVKPIGDKQMNNDRERGWFPILQPSGSEPTRIAIKAPDKPWTKADEVEAVEALGCYFRAHDTYLKDTFTTAFEGWIGSRILQDGVPDLFAEFQAEVARHEADLAESDGRERALEALLKQERDQRAAIEGAADAVAQERNALRMQTDELRQRLNLATVALADLRRAIEGKVTYAFVNDEQIDVVDLRDLLRQNVAAHQARAIAFGLGNTVQ